MYETRKSHRSHLSLAHRNQARLVHRHRGSLGRLLGWPFVAWMWFVAAVAAQPADPPAKERKQPTLAEILLDDVDPALLEAGAPEPFQLRPPPKIETVEAAAHGIRAVSGRHIELWTDLPQAFEIDELPRVFDLAVEQWARYFGVEKERFESWRVVGYLMGDPEKFQAAGFMPEDLPAFLHGFQRDHELWLKEQPSDYYRRHLLLHEGVHGFMTAMLGGSGPAWYREGIAELLATHRWGGGKLRVNVMPKKREDVPYWGRIKIVRDEFRDGKAIMVGDVLRLVNRDFLENRSYAWAWAVAAYMDGHPKYRNLYRQLRTQLGESPATFTRNLQKQLVPQLRQFDEQWQLFVSNIDYGYDFSAEMVAYQRGRPMIELQRSVTIKSNRGWQSTGLRLEGGRLYRIEATGQYQIRQRPETWWCEPGGVTLEYHRGMPLGVLLASIRLDEPRPGLANLCTPLPIGLRRHIRPTDSGTLYLRVNDRPGELSENAGELTAKITRIPPKKENEVLQRPAAQPNRFPRDTR